VLAVIYFVVRNRRRPRAAGEPAADASR